MSSTIAAKITAVRNNTFQGGQWSVLLGSAVNEFIPGTIYAIEWANQSVPVMDWPAYSHKTK